VLNTKTFVRLLATGLAASALSVGMIGGMMACTPKQETDTTPTQPTAPKPPPSEDIAIEDLSEIKLEGRLYNPDALIPPSMVGVKVEGKKLPAQRKAYAKAKDAKKVEEARVLATMLRDAETQATSANPAEAETLRNEMLTVLRETRQAGGETPDAVILQMLFASEWRAGNMDAAMEAGSALVTKYGDSKTGRYSAPFVAYAYLQQGKNAEAAQVVQPWTLEDPANNYTHAYVIAWVAFRQGNDALARQAMLQAARGWQIKRTWGTLQTEISTFLAHTGASVQDAVAVVTELEKDNQYIWTFQISEQYAGLGRHAEASELLNEAAKFAGSNMKPSELVTFRNRQYNYELMALNVDKSADYAVQMHQAVQACGGACAEQAAPVAEQVSTLAVFYHTIYSTTLDERFYGPAKKLYDYYLTLGQPDTETNRTYLSRLEQTKKLAAPGNGKHNKAVMDIITSRGRPEALKACYENTLQSEPTLVGAVKVTIEVDPQGKVTGATTDPASGETGLGKVAGCVQEQVRTWMFPGRTLAGTTRVVRSFAFSPAAQPAAQPAPAQ
jgi:hypothetical protein